MAEWALRGSSYQLSEYIDNSTIRRYQNKAKFWIMVDYVSTQKLGDENYLSVKYQYEFDCKKETNRTLAFVFYTANMGAGETLLLSDGKQSEWRPIVPDTGGEARFKIACGKK